MGRILKCGAPWAAAALLAAGAAYARRRK
ncbi:MAG: MprA protease, GlyGly-CTERM protein-sorting domain-containing form, partial [Chthoniobacterales bacterium]